VLKIDRELSRSHRAVDRRTNSHYGPTARATDADRLAALTRLYNDRGRKTSFASTAGTATV